MKYALVILSAALVSGLVAAAIDRAVAVPPPAAAAPAPQPTWLERQEAAVYDLLGAGRGETPATPAQPSVLSPESSAEVTAGALAASGAVIGLAAGAAGAVAGAATGLAVYAVARTRLGFAPAIPRSVLGPWLRGATEPGT